LQAQDGLGAVLRPATGEEIPQGEPRRRNPGRGTKAADGCREALLPTEHPHLLIIVAGDEANASPHQNFGIAVEMQIRGGCLSILQLEVRFEAGEVKLVLLLRERCRGRSWNIQPADQRGHGEKPKRVSVVPIGTLTAPRPMQTPVSEPHGQRTAQAAHPIRRRVPFDVTFQ
jgi:hypothetical protein